MISQEQATAPTEAVAQRVETTASVSGGTMRSEETRKTTREVQDNNVDDPPAFISRDPELKDTYERARQIYTDPNETEESRRNKIRVLQGNVGQEAVTLVLRYVPVVDLEDGTVQTSDSHMREMAETYDSERGSPIDRDPVGATMKILCLDWTERRWHLGGALGRAIVDAAVEAGCVRRVPGSRVVELTGSIDGWLDS